jgi:hypothetical protein
VFINDIPSTASTVFDLATADHFEFATDLTVLAANLNYNLSTYDISGLLLFAYV